MKHVLTLKWFFQNTDISNVYVKQFIDSNMAHADSLSALIPRSLLTVKNTTVPMGKFIQERQDHPN